jgi:hypothetical protein
MNPIPSTNPRPTVAILDDSAAVSNLWSNWLQEVSGDEPALIGPESDWKAQIDSLKPSVLFVDITSSCISAPTICRYVASSKNLTGCTLFLSCGFSDALDDTLNTLTATLGERAIVIRKPVKKDDFIATVSPALRKAIGTSNQTIPTLQLKDMTPKFNLPTDSVGTRFTWLNSDPTVTAYAVGINGEAAQAQGGRDCGDLMQGGAYFQELAVKIGHELGLENLRELQATCDGCRFLSLQLPGGLTANLLTQPEADLNTLVRDLNSGR